MEEPTPVIIQQKPYEYTISYVPIEPKKAKIYFSKKEIKHLTVAALLVTAVGLSFIGFSNIFSNDYTLLASFIIIFTASFFMHEIAHKIAAQMRGFWAEFRLTIMGALLTLISVISPFFKIISPGAVMISGFADSEKIGKISIAGPTTNITLATIFLAITFLLPQYSSIFTLGAAFNAWIALFNLIPFGMLDGFKVFLWSKKLWTLAFTASLVLTITSYGILLRGNPW